MTLCATASALAVAVTQRDEAAMLPGELGMIQPALADLLRGMGERAAQAVNQYGGLVVLAAGVGLWALRISQLDSAKNPQKSPAQKPVTTPAARVRPTAQDERAGYPPSDLLGVLGSAADVQ